MIGFIERLLLGPLKAKTGLNKRLLEPLASTSAAVNLAKNEIALYRGKDKITRHTFVDEIAKVVGGMDHYMVLSKCGKLFTFGSNDHGQLGTDICKNVTLWSALRADDDSEEIYDEPQLIETMDGETECKIVDIAAGHFSSFAITSDRELFAWGAGLLGLGDELYDSRPQLVPLKDAVSVQAWRDLVLVKNHTGECFVFGATLEAGKKVLKPTLCSIDTLPTSTEEYPDMPIHYFSHVVSTDASFTIPKPLHSSDISRRIYQNYNYAIYYL